MTDPLSYTQSTDPLSSGGVGPVRLAMADTPGSFPPGKTNPSKFMDYERRPAELTGGAPRQARAAPQIANAVRTAARMLTERQGGIPTVYIGDIVELLGASGLTKQQIHDTILEEARSGRAALARSSSLKLTDQQRSGGLALPDNANDTFHTVTFK